MFVSTGVQRRPPSGFIQPCLPSASDRPRTGPEWVREIKHDGYRLMARRAGQRVRLFTRRGYDWSDRYPRIVRAMRALKATSALIDGEAVWCGPDGAADFNKLHSRAHDDQVFMYAFDLLELDGEDLRARPLEERKVIFARLIGRADGLELSEHLEGDGKEIFEHVCKIGPRGHRLEAPGSPLRLRPGEMLDQGEESVERSDAAVRAGNLVRVLWPFCAIDVLTHPTRWSPQLTRTGHDWPKCET
jgi:bifunctional non-homologous end joining protein LigD